MQLDLSSAPRPHTPQAPVSAPLAAGLPIGPPAPPRPLPWIPAATWSGRLVLPDPSSRQDDGSVYLEIQNAPPRHRALVGRTVRLRRAVTDAGQQARERVVTRDICFTPETRASQQQGNWHPVRLDGWDHVHPLESLAGARGGDDVRVKLESPRLLPDPETGLALEIAAAPVEIAGTDEALVTVVGHAAEGDGNLRVRHFNPATRRFDGPAETVHLASVPRGFSPDRFIRGLERSPLNHEGWRMLGERGRDGSLEVRALEPRSLTALVPAHSRFGLEACLRYLERENWEDEDARKGASDVVLLDPRGLPPSPPLAAGGQAPPWLSTPFRAGERYLVLHLFGGIGDPGGDGKKPLGLVTGHFSFGLARVGADPHTSQQRFETTYRQVYAHNPEEIVSGASDWSCYMGSLDRGWAWSRPVSDVVVRLPVLDREHEVAGRRFSFLDVLSEELDKMEALYRNGGGDGCSPVTPTTSCSQDSVQALYATLARLQEMREDPAVQAWLRAHRGERRARDFDDLCRVADDLERFACPLGMPPPRWRANAENQPAPPAEGLQKWRDLAMSWNSLLPRQTHDALAQIFLRHGAQEWVMRTDALATEESPRAPLAPSRLPL